ncbi:hypothetical protein HYE15_02805 [Mycoplasmopsis bovis]|nr:hypothetical protein [Mycoplasmopsis bovis]QQH25610.1 hypothetical protein HYE15_02805 [Mycoplasmopsis bovis]
MSNIKNSLNYKINNEFDGFLKNKNLMLFLYVHSLLFKDINKIKVKCSPIIVIREQAFEGDEQ